MFNKEQHIVTMSTLRRIPALWALFFAFVFLASCSSVGDLPNDDVYYSKKTSNPGEYNWDDFQKNAQSYNSGSASTESTPLTEGTVYQNSSGNSSDIATTVSGTDADGDYQYIDEYYDGSYEDRINRFGSGSEGSGFDYYDGYNTSSGCNCGGGGNWSVGFGMGMGMGYYGSGWSLGYNYGWPSYGWGWPSYGWPYYGGSYMAGYYAGYNDAMWNRYFGWPYYYPYPSPYYGGYYGGGYYGGGYYEPAWYSNRYYGPRGRNTGGTSIPSGERNTMANRGDQGKKEGDPVIVSRGGGTAGATTAGRATSGNTAMGRPTGNNATTNPGDNQVMSRKANTSTQERMSRPNTTKQGVNNTSSSSVRQQPKYQKPKSYESISSQQPRSSQEYFRSTTNKRVTTTNTTNPYMRTNRSNTGSNSSNSFGTTTRSTNRYSGGSYSSPSRSSSTRSSSSYSSPSRSSGSSSGYNRSSGSSSSGSRSSGSRSSGSSGGGSRNTSRR